MNSFIFVNRIMENHKDISCCETPQVNFKIGKKLKLYSSLFILVFCISFLPQLHSLNHSLISYISLIWWAVLLGLLIGGLIEYFIPTGFIYKYLGQKKFSSLLYAVTLGFLMSACSHGILAIAMQLYKKGARIPVVITFLLASPWANLPITILLFGLFGWKAILFILAAMIIAVITGIVFTFLEKYNLIEQSKEITSSTYYDWANIKFFNLKKSINGVLRGSLNLANMVLWWILIGVFLSALIGAYLPENIFADYLNSSFGGIMFTLLFASIIEVCSEGSSPIAFEIYKQVGTLGNPFVFLMAGVVTDYTEIGLIWTTIGKKSAIWLPIVSVPLVVLTAIIFNLYL